MSLKDKSLYVMTPMYGGQLAMNYHDSFVQLTYLCRELNIPFAWSNVYNESLISRARNSLADSYLKTSTHSHALYIDADIGFDPRDVIAMLEMDKDILGVPCPKKEIRWDRIQNGILKRAFEWAHANPSCQNAQNPDALFNEFRSSGRMIDPAALVTASGSFVVNWFPWEGNKVLQVTEPQEVRLVGTGMLMVKREVFLKFKKAYPSRWYESRANPNAHPGPIHDFFKVGINPETHEYDSEDYWFIQDCAALGYKINLLPWVRTTHMGTFVYVGDMPSALAFSGEIM